MRQDAIIHTLDKNRPTRLHAEFSGTNGVKYSFLYFKKLDLGL